MTRLLSLALLAVTLGLVATAGAAHTVGRCRGAQLAGTFAVVPGSAGAGNITYALRLKNISASACSVTGLPQGTLLGRARKALPTRVRAAFPGALSAILVTLPAGPVDTRDRTLLTRRSRDR